MRELLLRQLRSTQPDKSLRFFVQEIKLCSAAKGPKKPPTEFRIFAYGRNRATHIGHAPEDVWLDEASADAVIAEWKRRKIKLVIDYEHASVKGEPEGAPAAGKFDLEKRRDGLWAVHVAWTARATAFLLADEYLYFSQGFTQRYDQTTGKNFVASIFHLALVNVPASDDQPLLMRSAAQRILMDELYDQIIQAIGTPLDEAQAAALKSVLASHGEMMSAKAAAVTAAAAPAEPDEKMKAITNAAMLLTGKVESAEVIGTLQAFKDGYVKAGQLVKTRAASNTTDLDKLLSDAEKQGKVEPGQKAELRAACLGPTGQVKPDALAILKVRLSAAIATGIGAALAHGSDAEVPSLDANVSPRDPKNVTVLLSATDREVCRLTGTPEADFIAQRQKEKVRLG